MTVDCKHLLLWQALYSSDLGITFSPQFKKENTSLDVYHGTEKFHPVNVQQ